MESFLSLPPAKVAGLIKSSSAPSAMEAPESLGGEKDVVVLGFILTQTYLDPM